MPEQAPPSPLILALENATMCGSVALVADGRCLGEYSLDSKRTHSQRLLTTIERALAETEQTIEAVDGIAVSLGPGSFTGLRIGLATAKGLAMATGKPLIGVPTLDALAAQAPCPAALVCPIIDARKQEVYAAFYRADEAGIPRRISHYLAIRPEILATEITEPTLFLGDGVDAYGKFLAERAGTLARFASRSILFPRAAAVGMLGVELFLRGEFLDATSSPIYVRPSEAEIHAGARQHHAQ